MTAPTVKRLERKIAALERMLLPNQVAVYKWAMRIDVARTFDARVRAVTMLRRACARARRGG